MSPKNLENISNFEGWGLTLVAYKKITRILWRKKWNEAVDVLQLN